MSDDAKANRTTSQLGRIAKILSSPQTPINPAVRVPDDTMSDDPSTAAKTGAAATPAAAAAAAPMPGGGRDGVPATVVEVDRWEPGFWIRLLQAGGIHSDTIIAAIESDRGKLEDEVRRHCVVGTGTGTAQRTSGSPNWKYDIVVSG